MDETVVCVKKGGHMWWPMWQWSKKKSFEIRLTSSVTTDGVQTTVKKEPYIEKTIRFEKSDVNSAEEATRRVIKLLLDGKIDIHDYDINQALSLIHISEPTRPY